MVIVQTCDGGIDTPRRKSSLCSSALICGEKFCVLCPTR